MDSESPPTPVLSRDDCTKMDKGKVPKRVHKAEREKMKRDHLNDLFLSLANVLEISEQANGKASILNGASRNVKELLAQIEQLKKENAALLSESQYVSMEKKELQDENSALESMVSKLQSEINKRASESNLDLNLAPPDPALQKAQMMMNPVFVYPVDLADPTPLPTSAVSKPLPRYPSPADVWSSQILGKQLGTEIQRGDNSGFVRSKA